MRRLEAERKRVAEDAQSWHTRRQELADAVTAAEERQRGAERAAEEAMRRRLEAEQGERAAVER